MKMTYLMARRSGSSVCSFPHLEDGSASGSCNNLTLAFSWSCPRSACARPSCAGCALGRTTAAHSQASSARFAWIVAWVVAWKECFMPATCTNVHEGAACAMQASTKSLLFWTLCVHRAIRFGITRYPKLNLKQWGNNAAHTAHSTHLSRSVFSFGSSLRSTRHGLLLLCFASFLRPTPPALLSSMPAVLLVPSPSAISMRLTPRG